MNVWKLCDVAQKGEKRMYIITATFLGQWEPGSNIGNLILFYEKEDDVIVLNSSNKKYQV